MRPRYRVLQSNTLTHTHTHTKHTDVRTTINQRNVAAINQRAQSAEELGDVRAPVAPPGVLGVRSGRRGALATRAGCPVTRPLPVSCHAARVPGDGPGECIVSVARAVLLSVFTSLACVCVCARASARCLLGTEIRSGSKPHHHLGPSVWQYVALGAPEKQQFRLTKVTSVYMSVPVCANVSAGQRKRAEREKGGGAGGEHP